MAVVFQPLPLSNRAGDTCCAPAAAAVLLISDEPAVVVVPRADSVTAKAPVMASPLSRTMPEVKPEPF